MTLPIVVLVLGWCLTALSLLGSRVLVIDAAAQAARLVARGEPVATLTSALRVSVVAIDHNDELVCVTVAATSGLIPVEARACALDDAE